MTMRGPRARALIRARPLLVWVVAAAFLGALVACSSPSTSTAPTTSGPPTSAEPPSEAPPSPTGPRTGGILVMARSQDPASLNPIQAADNGSIFADPQIFDTLVEAAPGPTILSPASPSRGTSARTR